MERATQVRCDANACAHWLPGDRCSAGAIEIAAQGEGPPRGGPGDTFCRTFRHRRGLAQVVSTLDNLDWSGLVAEPFRPGTQAAPEVRCRVRACLFWRDGATEAATGDASPGRCRAAGVQVSGQGATLPEETNCSTYLPASS